MGLLSGLNGFGLDGLDGMKLYEDPAEENKKKQNDNAEEPEKSATAKVTEADYVFEKRYTCPACGKDFKALSVKSNRARLKSIDRDLRPVYEHVEPLKYDVVMCPKCGCAALTRYWNGLTDNQRRLIKAGITAKFKPKTYEGGTYTYDQAFERYQIALANAMIKQAKPSEKAYICLRTGWLLRSKSDNLDSAVAGYEEEVTKTGATEREFLESALEGFVSARATETFPICGMDEMTMDYLLAALYVEFEKYDQAAKLIGSLLTNRNISSRMKDKALTLKEEIMSHR